MKVKQIKFKDFLNSSGKIAFKGFVLKNGSNIVNVNFTVLKGQPLLNGSLEQLLIKEATNYSLLGNIEISSSVYNKDDFEIIIDLASEVDFDNIQCVCNNNEKYHFKNIRIEYKASTGNWKRFNKNAFIPAFLENNIGVSQSADFEILNQYNVTINNENYINTFFAGVKNNQHSFTIRNHTPFDSGKHFYEVTFSKIDRNTSNSYLIGTSIIENNSDISNFTVTNKKGYFFSWTAASGYGIHRLNGSTEASIGTVKQSTDSVLPELTIGFFIDLVANKVKFVVNGYIESLWYDIVKTTADQKFYFVTQVRNMGQNLEFTLNTTPKYSYADLTEEYKRDHFKLNDGWKKTFPAIVLKKPRNSTADYPFIPWPWNVAEYNLVGKGIKFTHKKDYSIYRLTNLGESVWGYGYFKSTVQIDYPPVQPTSKRVVLFSISENKPLQTTWSNPLTGEYEFKRVKMKEPYLIFTYDSDEDYNAVVICPVYPSLMPEFVGLDLTVTN